MLLNLLRNLLTVIYFIMLLILPLQIFRFNYYNTIFPAMEIIISYVISVNKNTQHRYLFIFGLIADQLYNLPTGTYSLVLVLANTGLIRLKKIFLFQDYLIDLGMFCLYSFFIIALKYIIINITGNYSGGNTIYFYYLTTILSYPTCKLIMTRPLMIRHVK